MGYHNSETLAFRRNPHDGNSNWIAISLNLSFPMCVYINMYIYIYMYIYTCFYSANLNYMFLTCNTVQEPLGSWNPAQEGREVEAAAKARALKEAFEGGPGHVEGCSCM